MTTIILLTIGSITFAILVYFVHVLVQGAKTQEAEEQENELQDWGTTLPVKKPEKLIQYLRIGDQLSDGQIILGGNGRATFKD